MTEKVIEIPSHITVRDLADFMEASPIDVIKTLMANGVMANINQVVDFDTAEIVAAEMGYEVALEAVDLDETQEEGDIPLWRKLIAGEKESELIARPPVGQQQDGVAGRSLPVDRHPIEGPVRDSLECSAQITRRSRRIRRS